jgi:cell division protein FtsL
MRDELTSGALLGKSIDNSKIVREHDPRSHRDLVMLFVLALLLVGGLVLYAWPHLQLRHAGIEADQLSKDRDRLLEENRKLRLEKAALEDLRRVESVATRHLELQAPAPENVVVVETAPAPPPPSRVPEPSARGREPEAQRDRVAEARK